KARWRGFCERKRHDNLNLSGCSALLYGTISASHRSTDDLADNHRAGDCQPGLQNLERSPQEQAEGTQSSRSLSPSTATGLSLLVESPSRGPRKGRRPKG